MYPRIELDTDVLYVRDGNCLTAVGSMASLDLALDMVEEDLGKPLALTIARILVMPRVRTGDEPQLSVELRAQTAAVPKVVAAAEWIAGNIEKRLTVSALADRFAMSERNFSRAFNRALGMSPQRYIELARLETARRWLISSDLSIDAIARRSGYSNGVHFSDAFKKATTLTPSEYRENARERSGEN